MKKNCELFQLNDRFLIINNGLQLKKNDKKQVQKEDTQLGHYKNL